MNMTYDLVKDMATLTTIPEKALKKLLTKATYCINDAVADANGEPADIDVGFGTLSISVVNDKIVYKFTPSKEFEEAIKNTVLNEQNLLEDALEASLVDKITNVYKEFL